VALNQSVGAKAVDRYGLLWTVRFSGLVALSPWIPRQSRWRRLMILGTMSMRLTLGRYQLIQS
jgi:hypothetical protein